MNAPANDTCIEFDNVLAGYGEFMILNNLSFKAKRGKITLLLGPNGAGLDAVAQRSRAVILIAFASS